MIGKQRLVVGAPLGRLVADLPEWQELVGAAIPPLLIALTFLSLVLLQTSANGPLPEGGSDLAASTASGNLAPHEVDWRQTDGSNLLYRPVLK